MALGSVLARALESALARVQAQEPVLERAPASVQALGARSQHSPRLIRSTATTLNLKGRRPSH